MLIRPATSADLPAVAALYDREIDEGYATFDTEHRPLEAWQERLASTVPGDHLFVSVEDDGTVLGYANSAPYRPKLGYRHTREVSIYLAPAAQGRGLGRRLYDELLAAMRSDGMHVALAGVALPNDASVGLHKACGFEEVGTMREVGRKFDRWLDVLWLQKLL